MTNSSFKALGTALFATLLSCAAVAQTRYCIGGDLDRLSAGERASCSAAKELVKTTATRLHAPGDWHFVIVCGEQGWKDYTAVSQRGEVALEESSADTDFGQRITFLRASRLTAPESHDLPRVIAHEIASIELNTRDERAIEAQLTVWANTSSARVEPASSSIIRHDAKPGASAAGI